MQDCNEFIIGDLHISANWDGVDRTKDVVGVLEQIRYHIQHVIEEHPSNTYHWVYWLGDIFDSPNVSHVHIAMFMEYLSSFSSDKVAHKILKGNHDGDRDSRKGSPLLEIEASGLAEVFWEPTLEYSTAYVPYCSQAVLDKFVESLKPNEYIKRILTHTDFIGVTPGTEKQINRGLPCVFPQKLIDWPSKPQIIAGHIHEPSEKDNVLVLGSIIKTSISEIKPKRIWCHPFEEVKPYFWVPNSRDVKDFSINYSTDEGKKLYQKLLKNEDNLLQLSDIISVRMVCPHTLAHEIDQIQFKDTVSKYCHHLRFCFDVQKEKQFRMKELDVVESDIDIVRAWLTKQDVSDKDQILSEIDSLMEDH